MGLATEFFLVTKFIIILLIIMLILCALIYNEMLGLPTALGLPD